MFSDRRLEKIKLVSCDVILCDLADAHVNKRIVSLRMALLFSFSFMPPLQRPACGSSDGFSSKAITPADATDSERLKAWLGRTCLAGVVMRSCQKVKVAFFLDWCFTSLFACAAAGAVLVLCIRVWLNGVHVH